MHDTLKQRHPIAQPKALVVYMGPLHGNDRNTPMSTGRQEVGQRCKARSEIYAEKHYLCIPSLPSLQCSNIRRESPQECRRKQNSPVAFMNPEWAASRDAAASMDFEVVSQHPPFGFPLPADSPRCVHDLHPLGCTCLVSQV